jgi:hypothetical protein
MSVVPDSMDSLGGGEGVAVGPSKVATELCCVVLLSSMRGVVEWFSETVLVLKW